MRPNNNYKRNRNRNQSRRNGNGSPNKSNSIDSSGPDIRVRGNAIQVNEKYLALANDASTSGDRIKAEAFYQHADHYYRVFMLANGGIDPRKVSSEDNISKSISHDVEKNIENTENEKNLSNDLNTENQITNQDKETDNIKVDDIVSPIN